MERIEKVTDIFELLDNIESDHSDDINLTVAGMFLERLKVWEEHIYETKEKKPTNREITNWLKELPQAEIKKDIKQAAIWLNDYADSLLSEYRAVIEKEIRGNELSAISNPWRLSNFAFAIISSATTTAALGIMLWGLSVFSNYELTLKPPIKQDIQAHNANGEQAKK
jgi:hypothetical protein